jgi:uncharacterized GH25 family protein
MKRIFLCMLLSAFAPIGDANAHFIWLERDGDASARAYFGEWDRDVREKTGGSLDRIKSPKAWLGAGRKALRQERREDHIEILAKGAGDVVLVEAGLPPRDDKKAGGKTRTLCLAKVGRAATKQRLDFELVPVAPESEQFTLLFQGKPLPKAEITVFGPPKWSKSFRADESGQVAIETPWAGRYVIEAEHMEETPGEHGGEKYDRLRHVFTLSFVVSDGIAWNPAP